MICHIIQVHPYSYFCYTHNYQYCHNIMVSWKVASSYKFRIIFLESMDKKSDVQHWSDIRIQAGTTKQATRHFVVSAHFHLACICDLSGLWVYKNKSNITHPIKGEIYSRLRPFLHSSTQGTKGCGMEWVNNVLSNWIRIWVAWNEEELK
jgi:hypothetical protein